MSTRLIPCLSLFLCIMYCGLSAQSSGGRLKVLDCATDSLATYPVYSWGTIKAGRTYTAMMHITNIGADTLIVMSAKGSDGGFYPRSVSKDRLAHGDTATIELILDTRNRLGPMSKVMMIWSSDSLNPNIAVAVKANIIRDFIVRIDKSSDVLFPYIFIDSLHVGEERNVTLHIRNTSDRNMSVSPPIAVNGNISVRTVVRDSVLIRPGQERDVVLSIRASIVDSNTVAREASGMTPLYGIIRCGTSNIDFPSINISVYGRLRFYRNEHAIPITTRIIQ